MLFTGFYPVVLSKIFIPACPDVMATVGALSGLGVEGQWEDTVPSLKRMS
jgi:hypothetical protein